MAKPNVFISHRWAYKHDYDKLVEKLNDYGFTYLDYSVPEHDPLDVNKVNEIEDALREQVRQSNYVIVFANMAIGNSIWCQHELNVAAEYNKPVLSVKPWGYSGNIPKFIQAADTENGPVGFNTPTIIKKICSKLNHPLPEGIY